MVRFMARSSLRVAAAVAFAALAAGCNRWFIHDADREVNRLIASRQQAALGESYPVPIGEETGRSERTGNMYRYAPHPVDPSVPEGFKASTRPRASSESPETPAPSEPSVEPEPGRVGPDSSAQPTTQPSPELDAALGQSPGEQPTTEPAPVEPGSTPSYDSEPTSQPAAAGPALRFTLGDCLAYALTNAREYQNAKEDLYLSALALSLERHLWTPQFSGSLSYEFADYGQVRDFDRAMTAVAQLAMEQRLPLGGTVTAQVIDRWMRDLKVHTTSGETGAIILSADIPLLRGAGRTARESLYQAERDLIYSVRDFEHFRRQFLVDVAGDFFDLLSLRAQIGSSEAQVESLRVARNRAEALAQTAEGLKLDANRAQVEYRSAQNRVISARERYETSLDLFKIRLGMSTEAFLELIEEQVELYEPEVTEEEAIATAMVYRLDLLNSLDAVDDARRGVEIAKNSLLPDLNFSGSISMDTNPNKPSTVEYNTERTTWRGLVEMELPLDRKRERNELRSALIDLRRAERGYDQFRDQVRAEVRRTKRQIELARLTLAIQQENISIGEFRAAQAEAMNRTGRLQSNRDLIEAQNDLRDARNSFASALSDYRRTILEFLLAAGALRIGDDGKWETYQAAPSSAESAPAPIPGGAAHAG